MVESLFLCASEHQIHRFNMQNISMFKRHNKIVKYYYETIRYKNLHSQKEKMPDKIIGDLLKRTEIGKEIVCEVSKIMDDSVELVMH